MAAYTHVTLTLPGLRANSTGLATAQFKIGKLASTAGQVVLNATSVFAGVLGIIMNAPGAGEEVEFAVSGVAKVLVSTSTIKIGDGVGSNTASLGTDGGTTDNGSIIGKALTDATAATGDIVSVLLTPGGARY